MSKADAKRAADAVRRAAIMNAAFETFVEKGFETSTTLEIARRAKTSKRALYEMFGSKHEILIALIRWGSSRMQAPGDLPPPTSREVFLGALGAFGQRFLMEYLDPSRMALYRLAIAEAGRGGSTVARELDSSGRAPVAQFIARYFEQAAATGLLPQGDVARLVYVYFSVLIGASPLQLLLETEPPATPKRCRSKAATAVAVLRDLLP